MTCSIALALVMATSISPVGRSPDNTYDDLLHSWLKLNGESGYSAYSEAYLQVYRKDVWARVKGNEIKLDAEKGKTIDAMKQRADKLDLTKELTLSTKLTFGKYDTAAGVFPLIPTAGDGVTGERGHPFTDKAFWFVKSSRPTGSFPPQCKVYFNNPELLAKLPLIPEAAGRLLDGRKESQRVLNARVQLRLVAARASTGELLAEVQSVTFTDPIRRNAQVLTITKPTESTLKGGQ